jgi:tRNA threonylcarbamoyladenosine biosynthesis protein TsaE
VKLPFESVADNEAETAAIACRFGRKLAEGAWVILTGPLGAGKTAFVRGLAEGLGIDPRLVHSPTYTLVSEYRGARTLAHVDLYRIEEVRELEELGLDDLQERNVTVAVEWGDRLPPGVADDLYEVSIEVISEESRKIRVKRR